MFQSILNLLTLRVLRHSRLNGWDIMQRIQLVSGDVLNVIPSLLYLALHRPEARRLVAAEGGASIR